MNLGSISLVCFIPHSNIFLFKNSSNHQAHILVYVHSRQRKLLRFLNTDIRWNFITYEGSAVHVVMPSHAKVNIISLWFQFLLFMYSLLVSFSTFYVLLYFAFEALCICRQHRPDSAQLLYCIGLKQPCFCFFGNSSRVSFRFMLLRCARLCFSRNMSNATYFQAFSARHFSDLKIKRLEESVRKPVLISILWKRNK